MNLLKWCYKCKKMKELSAFGKNVTTKDKLQIACKPCNSANSLAWQKKNPEKQKVIAERRKKAKLERMLKWGKEHLKPEIDNWYRRAKLATIFMGEPYEVDHIEPLKGKDISGLHVPWNLTLLTKPENSEKGNRRVEQESVTPISIRNDSESQDNTQHGVIYGAGVGKNSDSPFYNSGVSSWQNINSSTKKGSRVSMVTRVPKMGTPKTFKSNKDNGKPQPAYGSNENQLEFVYYESRELSMVTGTKSEVRLPNYRRIQSFQRFKHKKVQGTEEALEVFQAEVDINWNAVAARLTRSVEPSRDTGLGAKAGDEPNKI